MSRSSVRLPAALRSRRARFAAPAVVGAVALSALAVPAYAAAPPAAKPKVIATVDVGVSAKGVAVSQETGDVYVVSGRVNASVVSVISGRTNKVTATSAPTPWSGWSRSARGPATPT